MLRADPPTGYTPTMSTDVQWLLPPAQKPAELVIQWQPSAPPAPPQAAAYIDERWAEYESQAKAAGSSGGTGYPGSLFQDFLYLRIHDDK